MENATLYPRSLPRSRGLDSSPPKPQPNRRALVFAGKIRAQIRKKIFLLYIQYNINQNTPNTAAPSKNGCNPGLPNAKSFAPKCIRKVEKINSGVKCAIKYAAIEFIPITISGNAHFLYPFASITQQNAAKNRKQIPPLNSVQLGVQILFTIGQIPTACSSNPAASPPNPASNNFLNGIAGAVARNHRPAINPKIIVPSVGIKLSVKYPPSFATNGEVRGNKFRNH